MKHVLCEIPFEIERSRLMKRLHLAPDSGQVPEVDALLHEAQQIAHPKALYRLAFVEHRDSEQIVIDGVTLTSRVLSVNLGHVYRAFVYAATCGRELQDWATSLSDVLHRFWADAIQEMALWVASRALYTHIVETYQPGATSTMAPGSLGDWPLTQQRPLFRLLGDTKAEIGLELTDSLLMIPFKSVSGIRFPTEEKFESCMLCPRADCPGRRAPYDRNLYERRYAHSSGAE